ncbi:MAG: argininosuccinate synthase [Candidatus Anaerobiospirillum merdipullorum]|uniref:Argininosuccinate synthase n=1 Tax=Candidatus Anaerobiospirillum merdipullorum TaxID=2838450 RepID=A0A9E2KL02_9GAMM|nr:argininosuccinate synthase [Candidatus Anaerobiospirillum merdipullorum]
MLKHEKKQYKKVVLAYSGGLDTSTIVPWLKENYGCEVVCFVADVGQEREDLDGIEQKAIQSGATKCIIKDLREEFVRDYVFETFKTGALYEGEYLLGTAIARPVIAKAMVECALEEGADAVAHGATGKGNDQVRFESAVAALAPHLDVIAPWREWTMQSREELLAYLQERNIPCKATLKKIYSRDANVLHISTEGGELEDTWNPASENVWVWTCDPQKAPDTPETFELTVKDGCVTALNGEEMSPFALISALNDLGAKHGVGRIDITENRLVGMKSRGCYETPGGTIIYKALRAVEQLVLDKSTRAFRDELAVEFSHLVYDGRWFTRLREIMQAAADELAHDVNGKVVVRLYKGHCDIIQKSSPNSLFNFDFVTFGADDVYDQHDAEGFIRLYSLPARIRALNAAKNAK